MPLFAVGRKHGKFELRCLRLFAVVFHKSLLPAFSLGQDRLEIGCEQADHAHQRIPPAVAVIAGLAAGVRAKISLPVRCCRS